MGFIGFLKSRISNVVRSTDLEIQRDVTHKFNIIGKHLACYQGRQPQSLEPALHGDRAAETRETPGILNQTLFSGDKPTIRVPGFRLIEATRDDSCETLTGNR